MVTRGPKVKGRTCEWAGCSNLHRARGFCDTHYRIHYRRLRKAGLLPPPRTITIKDRVADALETDGGWLTVEGINLLLPDLQTNQIRYALDKLQTSGRVEHRSMELAMSTPPRFDWRREWRLIP